MAYVWNAVGLAICGASSDVDRIRQPVAVAIFARVRNAVSIKIGHRACGEFTLIRNAVRLAVGQYACREFAVVGNAIRIAIVVRELAFVWNAVELAIETCFCVDIAVIALAVVVAIFVAEALRAHDPLARESVDIDLAEEFRRRDVTRIECAGRARRNPRSSRTRRSEIDGCSANACVDRDKRANEERRSRRTDVRVVDIDDLQCARARALNCDDLACQEHRVIRIAVAIRIGPHVDACTRLRQ